MSAHDPLQRGRGARVHEESSGAPNAEEGTSRNGGLSITPVNLSALYAGG